MMRLQYLLIRETGYWAKMRAETEKQSMRREEGIHKNSGTPRDERNGTKAKWIYSKAGQHIGRGMNRDQRVIEDRG